MGKVSYYLILSALVIGLSSCEGCVRKASKKATELGLSVVEGVSEALDEHGARVSEKATDALGQIVSGAGRSIDRLLNEHAATVAEVVGRTLVQSFEGFEGGIATEFYDPMNNVVIILPDRETVTSVEFMGKITSSPVIDTYMIIDSKGGTFTLDFAFEGADGSVVMEKRAEAAVVEELKYTVVSFALSSEELVKWSEARRVTITMTKQGDVKNV